MSNFTAKESGRLDKILSIEINQSRNQVNKLICDELVKVNNKIVVKSSHKIKIEDTIEYIFKEAIKKEALDVDFDVEILYEDDDILVVNKPNGVIIHPAPSVKEPTLVDWLIKKGISLSTISGEERHGIVHRIDKETTGALVVAKNNEAHQKLSEQLQDKSMGRYYLAIIDCPLKDDIVVDKPIGRSQANRLKMAVLNGAKEAKSLFRKLSLSKIDKRELISAKLYTGRTHQVRVHLASLGRHIIGDELYGFSDKRDRNNRVQLHAYILYLIHPSTGKKMQFVAPMFDDMIELLNNKFDIDEVKKQIRPENIVAI